MAAGVSNLELDAFFKDAYLLPDIDGSEVLGDIHPDDDNTAIVRASLESQNKEAFDKYKALFVKFKELVNTRKKVNVAGGAAAPGINSHTKNELNKQYEKQLKELAASISDSSSLKTTIDTSVGAIAASAAATASAASEKIRRIFTEFLKIRVKGRLEKGKFLMDELFNEPEEVIAIETVEGENPSGNNLQIIRMKDGHDILSKFKEKYAYLKEVYSEGDRKFIDTLLTGLKKEKASYIPDLIYTLAKLVPEFIPFTQAGRLVKDINTYIQSGSPISLGRDELVDAVSSTATATEEAMDKRERLHGELEDLRYAVIEAKAAASEANAASAAASKVALDKTNSEYFKAFDNYIKADLEYKAANKRYWDALKNFAPVPQSVREEIDAGTIPRGTPVVTAVKILELRRLNVTNVPLLKKEVEKIDKYIKAIAAVEGLRENKHDANVYVKYRSVVNTLFTEKGSIEFFSRHLPEGFIEKLETEDNYKELLRKAIFGEELAGKKEKGGEEGEAGEAEEAVKKARRGKVLYKEADDSYNVKKLGFFDKLAGKALSKKELAEWWKKRGGKFNIGQTIPEPIVTIFTETFNLKKKSKKELHFTQDLLINRLKNGDDAAGVAAAVSRPAVAGAGPAVAGAVAGVAAAGVAAAGVAAAGPAVAGAVAGAAKAKGSEEKSLEVTAKGFANNGIYDQEDGLPIFSDNVKSGTMFEMYYLGWLDKTVPAPPPAAAPPAAPPPAAPPPAAPAPAAPPPAAAPASSRSVSAASSPPYTPQQKKAITKMMKSLFSFVFSDIEVRDANKKKRFHDAYRIAYTVLEKHQKIPCKKENLDLHNYFKKSLEFRREIATRELAATIIISKVFTPGMEDHYKQLITGLSGLITFLENDVEGQPCIVYGDTLAGEDTAQGGDVNSELLLQLLTQYIKQRKNGSRPVGKDALMAFLKQRNIPLRDINQVYKELESMLTDYANLTKENPELRDLVVLFSQIALHIQQLGDIRLELEKLQHLIDKCADRKEKKRLAELFADKVKIFTGIIRTMHNTAEEEEAAAANAEAEAFREKLDIKKALIKQIMTSFTNTFPIKQTGGARKTSVKSLSQGMLLLFLVELRKSKQLKSAKEVQDLVNKAGKALDSIGQYELVLTILQEIVGNINIHTEEGYTYVKLNDLKEEKANALVESYNHVFSKSDSKMFKSIGTTGSFHTSAPEEFEEVLGKGPFCLVLDEDKDEGKKETPLHGVSDEYQVVLEEKERNVLEDNGGIPLGGVIFLYLVCLNELYCDSSDEECIRPTR